MDILAVTITILALTPFVFLIHTLGARKKRTDQQFKENLERIQYAFEGYPGTAFGIGKPNTQHLYLSPGLNNLLGIEVSTYPDSETLTSADPPRRP